ncbi:hypothetical protein D9M72_520790 [compost metagenome]
MKKSGKIAEAPPRAAAGWKPSIFLDFEGARTPIFKQGKTWWQTSASPPGNRFEPAKTYLLPEVPSRHVAEVLCCLDLLPDVPRRIVVLHNPMERASKVDPWKVG